MESKIFSMVHSGPLKPAAYYSLVYSLYQQQMYAEALDEAENFFCKYKNSNHTDDHLDLWYKKTARLREKIARIYYDRSSTIQNRNRYMEATRIYEQFEPDSNKFARADLQAKEGQYRESIITLMKIQPESQLYLKSIYRKMQYLYRYAMEFKNSQKIEIREKYLKLLKHCAKSAEEFLALAGGPLIGLKEEEKKKIRNWKRNVLKHLGLVLIVLDEFFRAAEVLEKTWHHSD